jgi:ABC-type dipeptide/oligopeptide/nickel transport system permease component
MVNYIIYRLLQIIPVLLLLSIVVFGLLHIAGGDPARLIAGETASREDIEAIRAKFGLDKPIHIQYGIWLGHVLSGDLGNSIVTRRPVTAEIADRIWPTVELATTAMFLATLVGIAVGIVSAVRQYSLLDHLSMVMALFGVSTPIFWLGLMLIYLFAVELRWLPSGGMGSLKALILPSITLGAASAAIVARMTRSSLLEVIRQDYIRTARAKGLPERTVLLRHSLKNAFIPIVTVIGLQYGYLLGGTVVTETVFSRPGIGRMLVNAITTRDFPVVQGTIMVLAVTFVIVNLVVDLIYIYLDPRIHYD